MGPIITLALMLLLFWVLIVLPQRRRMAAQRALVESVTVGDEVMTTAGLHATVVSLDGDVAELQVAEGVVVRSARWAIARRITDESSDADGIDGAEGAATEPAATPDDDADAGSAPLAGDGADA